jgi:uncharacterized protein YndB with AHSA1/START domain
MVTIVKELAIETSPERVWGALTQPDELGHWWTNDLNAAPELGSLAEFRFGEWGEVVLRFEVTELERDKKVHWMYRFGSGVHWAGTSITWQLTPVSNGTRVVFTHGEFVKKDEVFEQTRGYWNYFLASLKSYLETGKGTPGTPPGFN